MTTNTLGIVLRNVKYGETSIISTLYTRDFGMQAYIVRGARSNRKTGIKANYFQIGQLLELTVYHKPNKNLQYIKEVKLNAENAIQSQNIVKQSIVQFCSELVLRCIKEEEENPGLFKFLSDFFKEIKGLKKENFALAPLQFTVQFAAQIGFEIHNNHSLNNKFFDPLNGEFSNDISINQYTTEENIAQLIAHCLKSNRHIITDNNTREATLRALLLFLHLQIEQMGDVKSVAILHQILHD